MKLKTATAIAIAGVSVGLASSLLSIGVLSHGGGFALLLSLPHLGLHCGMLVFLVTLYKRQE